MNPNRRGRILVVDDEPEIRMLVVEILAQCGFEIWEAGNAAEAIRILRVFAPHLLITDYSLPDANGNELVKRAKRVFPDLKCLMLTGWRELPDRLGSSSLADVVMSKPFSVEALERETLQLRSAGGENDDSTPAVAQQPG